MITATIIIIGTTIATDLIILRSIIHLLIWNLLVHLDTEYSISFSFYYFFYVFTFLYPNRI